MSSELINLTARQVHAKLVSGELTPHDLLDVLEIRIAEVDGDINALPTLCFERARVNADRLLELPIEERGPLAGMPVPIKDLSDVAGVRTTYGSLAFADNVPQSSAYLVERLEKNGAIIYAKSNTPEFGAGGNTFNEVLGMTRNPWNLKLSAAGSSGGAAAALASGTAWLAQGSDMGGSLRNPASFCGVVGLRPSAGLVSDGPASDPYDTLGVSGPMARNVGDVAFLLDAMAGLDPRDPLSYPVPEGVFQSAAEARKRPQRVAFSPDLGITPVDPEVATICRKAAEKFSELGIEVVEAQPDFSGVHEAFQILRAHNFATGLADVLEGHRDKLKPEVVWNIEKGLALTGENIRRAQRIRGDMIQRAAGFFEVHDLLLTPATIVPPYPVEERYVRTCNGHEFETYVDWLAIAYAVTMVSLPALALPCGFTGSGLPVGLQMVAGRRNEEGLLGFAGLLEDALSPSHLPVTPVP